MPEKEKSPETENHSTDIHPEPIPDSIFKAFLPFIWNLNPVVKWGILIVLSVGVIIVGIWDRIPTDIQKQIIVSKFSCSKSEPHVSPTDPSELKNAILAKEIRDKGLLSKIHNAENYLMVGGSSSNKEKALKIYQDVLAKLSQEATHEFDQDLLAQAKFDDRKGQIDDALLKYKALFERVLNEN